MTRAQNWQDTPDDLERRRRHTWDSVGADGLTTHHDEGEPDARSAAPVSRTAILP